MDKQYLRDARISRVAKICCNISLFCGILLLLFGLMPVIQALYYFIMLMFAAVVLTGWLLSLLLFHPFDVSFLGPMFDSGSEAFLYIKQYTFRFAPYFCAVAVALGIVAILLITRDKSVKRTGRIVAASLAIGFAVVGTVASILGGVL
ncbi:MAG: hypothetical protein K2N14_01385 [Clostridia bacterium]|nr:hypothetical protein [Clostridia bacterium]